MKSGQRLAAAAAAAAVGVAVCLWWQTGRTVPSDLDQLLFGARELLRRADPYTAIGPGRAFQWSYPLYYPATALALVAPLAALPVLAARTAFVALSCGLLGYAAAARGWPLVPMLASTPFLMSAALVQWPPLLTAAYGLPALAFVWAAKPNFALPFLLAGVPRKAIVVLLVGGGLLMAFSVLCFPSWPFAWVRALRDNHSLSALVLSPYGGPLLLLAAIRWRDRGARLLLGMACIPQTVLLYNALPLFLVTRGRREAMALTVLSWLALAAHIGVGYVGGSPVQVHERGVGVVVTMLYLPVLLMVLLRGRHGRGAAADLMTAEHVAQR